MHPAPGLEAGVQRGVIAAVHQPHVVVDDAEPAVSLHDLLVHRLDLRLVGEIGLHNVFTDEVPGLIDPDNDATLAREPPGHRPADRARSTVDDVNSADEPRHRHP